MCKVIEDVREEGIEIGREEGIEIGIEKMVLRMLAAGKNTIEDIVSISGLSLEEVKQLQAKQTAPAT